MLKKIPKSMYREGLELCEENAVRLIEEANKIFQIGAFTAAFFFGVYGLGRNWKSLPIFTELGRRQYSKKEMDR